MQRGHNDDLAAYLIDSGVELLSFPNEFEGNKRPTSIGWIDPRTEEGELLCPERLGREMTESLRITLGDVAFSAQFQQRPVPIGGGIFKRDSFVRYHKAQLPDRVDTIVVSWDMSFKDTTDSSYVAGQVWGFLGADAFLLDLVRVRATFTQSLSLVLRMDRRWPQANVTLVEDKANGTAIVNALKSQVPGLIGVPPEGGKIARGNAVAPKVEAGNVHVPAHAPWVEAFLDEASAFPIGRYDDQVDAMTQALSRYYRGHGHLGFIPVRA
jgi:predicted phage terminase large subunit-like protein